MIHIPGWIISFLSMSVALLTFPGIIVHEIAHRFFCDITETPVYDICYLRVGNPLGYVKHGEVTGLKDLFLISIGPLIVNTMMCMLLTLPFMYPVFILGTGAVNPIFSILAWFGFSVGMHAFPSDVDMDNLVREVKTTKQRGVLFYIAAPFAALVGCANYLSLIWMNLFYAIGVSCILPLILLALITY